jgi:hypothetical protein
MAQAFGLQQGHGPQPDFNLIVQHVNAAMNEASKIPNMPLVGQGDMIVQLLQGIRQDLQRVQQDVHQVQQDLQRVQQDVHQVQQDLQQVQQDVLRELLQPQTGGSNLALNNFPSVSIG